MKKKEIRLSLLAIAFVVWVLLLVSVTYAEETGMLKIDLTPEMNTSMLISTTATTPEFQPMHVKVVKITDEKEITFWESDITEQKDVNIPVPSGNYKLYVQLHGHRTIWEIDNEGMGYDVSLSTSTVVPMAVNVPLRKEVFADAPWRVQSDRMPILVMVKDADEYGDYDLGNVEVYLDEDCDEDNDVSDDTPLGIETKWYGTKIDASSYNLYNAGDWYGITHLTPTKYNLSGNICFHVVIKEIGDIWDWDAHSYFKVNIASNTLPSLTNWYGGDTHYHSSYTDNSVEFGFPVEATVEAGKAIGLDWNAITDHSFDLDSHMTSKDETRKWSQLGNECNHYSDSSFKCIRGEEISVRNSEGKYVHLLAYNVTSYLEGEGADGEFPIYEDNYDSNGDGWDDVSITLTLSDALQNINSQRGFGYAAHPADDMKSKLDILKRDKWGKNDYNLVRDSNPDNDYVGLQIWNTIDAENDLQEGLIQWKNLLLNNSHIFISGGSDAHGDFSDSKHYVWSLDYIEETDNAFGKVRTYVYTEDFSNEGILNALRYGHSIMTDGPIVVFDIDGTIIGNSRETCMGKELDLNIQWNTTAEFGNIDNITIINGIIRIIRTDIISGKDGKEIVYDIIYPTSNDGTHSIQAFPNQDMYFRLTGMTSKGYRVYTNPIWLEGDSTSPTSEITFPYGESIVSGVITLESTETDNCGVNSVEYSIDLEYWSLMNLSGSVAAANINTSSYDDGAYTIYVRGVDDYENVGQTSSVTLTFDNTAPNITFVSPLNNSQNKGERLFLNVTTDENAMCYYRLDGGEYFNFSYEENGMYFSEEIINLTKEGDIPHYVVEVNCADVLGNLKRETLNFYLDLPPMIALNPVSDYVRDVVWLYADVFDYVGLETSCEVCVSADSLCDTEWTSDNVTGNFSIGDFVGQCMYQWNTSNVTEANYTVGFRVKDTMGNTVSNQTMTIVDNTLPILSIINPFNGSTISGESVWLNVSTDEITSCYISDSYEYLTNDNDPPQVFNATPIGEHNGNCPIELGFVANERSVCKGNLDDDASYEEMDITFHTYNFQEYMTYIDLSSGNSTDCDVTIYVKCKDMVGNMMLSSYNWTFNVTYSPFPPACGISSGSSGMLRPYSEPDEHHAWSYNVTDDYTYSRKVTCFDRAGNFNESLVFFSVDNSAPQVTINEPKAMNYSSMYLTLNVSADETANCSYALNGVAGAMLFTDSKNGALAVTAKIGANIINISCVDRYGNINSTESVMFTVIKATYEGNTDIISAESSILNASMLDTLLEISTNSNFTNSSINITQTLVNPTNASFGVTEIGKYIQIEVGADLLNNLTSALIKIFYTDEEIEGLNENSLAVYWYNESSFEWIELDEIMDWVYGTGVNTTANYAWANVSHFSTYGVGGQKPDGELCSGTSECAGGYCVHGICRSSSTYCGDSYCDSGEICSSCESDCGVCQVFSSSGGGSGVIVPPKEELNETEIIEEEIIEKKEVKEEEPPKEIKDEKPPKKILRNDKVDIAEEKEEKIVTSSTTPTGDVLRYLNNPTIAGLIVIIGLIIYFAVRKPKKLHE